ncbi:MAG: hypothetical protein NC331_06680 [Lachnospiraceae bacterium]|nr:hypothetical protein [Lachnospiraceae bacterium]MCM1239056.1 hypothetical protein [Lachnospiraceae bacterium]
MILIMVTTILMIVTTIPTTPTASSSILCTFPFIFHYIPPPRYWKFSKCTHFGERRTAHHFGNTHDYYTRVQPVCQYQYRKTGAANAFISVSLKQSEILSTLSDMPPMAAQTIYETPQDWKNPLCGFFPE